MLDWPHRATPLSEPAICGPRLGGRADGSSTDRLLAGQATGWEPGPGASLCSSAGPWARHSSDIPPWYRSRSCPSGHPESTGLNRLARSVLRTTEIRFHACRIAPACSADRIQRTTEEFRLVVAVGDEKLAPFFFCGLLQ